MIVQSFSVLELQRGRWCTFLPSSSSSSSSSAVIWSTLADCRRVPVKLLLHDSGRRILRPSLAAAPEAQFWPCASKMRLEAASSTVAAAAATPPPPPPPPSSSSSSSVSCSLKIGRRLERQSGHVECDWNQTSIQSTWNAWLQAGSKRSRRFSSLPNSFKHTAQSRDSLEPPSDLPRFLKSLTTEKLNIGKASTNALLSPCPTPPLCSSKGRRWWWWWWWSSEPETAAAVGRGRATAAGPVRVLLLLPSACSTSRIHLFKYTEKKTTKTKTLTNTTMMTVAMILECWIPGQEALPNHLLPTHNSTTDCTCHISSLLIAAKAPVSFFASKPPLQKQIFTYNRKLLPVEFKLWERDTERQRAQ